MAGSWAPVRDIKFRGNYNRAVRAPNIAELFSPDQHGADQPVGRSVRGRRSGNQPGGWRDLPCAGSAGKQIGIITNPTAGQANITTGGNLLLKPETASTWTVGAVIRPRFFRGFSATVDYYNIRVKNAMTIPTPGDLISACFGSSPYTTPVGTPTSPACTVIRRNTTTGALDGDPATVGGLFGIVTQPGTDLDRRCRSDHGLSSQPRRDLRDTVQARAGLRRQLHAQPEVQGDCEQPDLGEPRVRRILQRQLRLPGRRLLPKYSFNERTTLSLGRVDLSLLWRYMSSMKYEPGLPPLFSGTIASINGRSEYAGYVQWADGQFQPYPGVQLVRLRDPVQRQRALRADVDGHEHPRQEAADRGQHGRYDVAEQRQHLPGDL